MLFRMRSNMLFRLFHLLTAQVGSNFVIICTNSWDCYRYGRGSAGGFTVSRLSQDEVLEYNKSIAKYGNKLIIKNQNYDVKKLFI